MSWTPTIKEGALPEGLRSIKNNEIWLHKEQAVAFYDHSAKTWKVYNPKYQDKSEAIARPADWSPLPNG